MNKLKNNDLKKEKQNYEKIISDMKPFLKEKLIVKKIDEFVPWINTTTSSYF